MRKLTFTQACAQFTNRYTAEHVPAWARKPCEGNGLFYAPQFASDREWYENTKFHGEPGHFGTRDECFTSGQTWPHGKWLAQAFVKGRAPVRAEILEAYLQHGTGGGPFRTESVEVKRAPTWWQEKGLQFTASGYGSRIPTEYMVRVGNRWRRVYCRIFSNVGSLFIGNGENRISVQIDRMGA